MKFFIDTANLAQIKEANELGILDGVTTNPSLMAKEGITGTENIYKHYKAICAIVDGDVSAEVISTDYKGMIEEGQLLADLAPNIVVKVPMTKDGIKAIHWLTSHNIRTNCTLVFSAGQAILAAKAGATYLSPFIGRVDDINWDGMALIQDGRRIGTLLNIRPTEVVLDAQAEAFLRQVQSSLLWAALGAAALSLLLGILLSRLLTAPLVRLTHAAQAVAAARAASVWLASAFAVAVPAAAAWRVPGVSGVGVDVARGATSAESIMPSSSVSWSSGSRPAVTSAPSFSPSTSLSSSSGLVP